MSSVSSVMLGNDALGRTVSLLNSHSAAAAYPEASPASSASASSSSAASSSFSASAKSSPPARPSHRAYTSGPVSAAPLPSRHSPADRAAVVSPSKHDSRLVLPSISRQLPSVDAHHHSPSRPTLPTFASLQHLQQQQQQQQLYQQQRDDLQAPLLQERLPFAKRPQPQPHQYPHRDRHGETQHTASSSTSSHSSASTSLPSIFSYRDRASLSSGARTDSSLASSFNSLRCSSSAGSPAEGSAQASPATSPRLRPLLPSATSLLPDPRRLGSPPHLRRHDSSSSSRSAQTPSPMTPSYAFDPLETAAKPSHPQGLSALSPTAAHAAAANHNVANMVDAYYRSPTSAFFPSLAASSLANLPIGLVGSVPAMQQQQQQPPALSMVPSPALSAQPPSSATFYPMTATGAPLGMDESFAMAAAAPDYSALNPGSFGPASADLIAPTAALGLTQDDLAAAAAMNAAAVLPPGAPTSSSVAAAAAAAAAAAVPSPASTVATNASSLAGPAALVDARPVPEPAAPKGPKKKYPCPHAARFGCSDTFTTSGHAARHGKKHTGEKNVLCPTCHKAFTRKDNMKQHERTHRPNRDSVSSTSVSADGTSRATSSVSSTSASGSASKRARSSTAATGPDTALLAQTVELDALPPLDSADLQEAAAVVASLESHASARPQRKRKGDDNSLPLGNLQANQRPAMGRALTGQSSASLDGEGESPGLDALAMAASGLS